MATPKTMSGTQLLVQIGDGATPTENFAQDCLINSERGISFSTDTNEFVVPDCTNPDDPAWKEVTKDGLSAEISGSGVLHTSSVSAMYAFLTGAATKNMRVKLNNVTLANGGGYWAGAFHLTSFEVTGNRGEKAQVSLTFRSNGVVTWVPAAA